MNRLKPLTEIVREVDEIWESITRYPNSSRSYTELYTKVVDYLPHLGERRSGGIMPRRVVIGFLGQKYFISFYEGFVWNEVYVKVTNPSVEREFDIISVSSGNIFKKGPFHGVQYKINYETDESEIVHECHWS